MYHIAVVDDEEKFIEQLLEYLKRYEAEENVRFKVTVFHDGYEILNNYTPQYDVILLDIEMPKVNGMEAARIIRSQDEDVVLMFITNMAKYALNGYEVGALDFVMKPITYPAFSMRLTRVMKRVLGKKQEQILLTLPDGIKPLELSQIYYIEVQGHTLTYHTKEGEFSLRGSMTGVAKQMASYPFVKSSNYCLVNLVHVTEVRGNQVLVNGVALDISRRNKSAFLKSLTEYVGGRI